jgi:hypothetical protein
MLFVCKREKILNLLPNKGAIKMNVDVEELTLFIYGCMF